MSAVFIKRDVTAPDPVRPASAMTEVSLPLLVPTSYRTTDYSSVCSYNLLPAECKGSAARIRILEHRLAKARECIGKLQKQLPDNDSSDLEQTLAPQSELRPSVHISPISMAFKTSAYSSPVESVSTAGVGFSLIESLLQPLSSLHQVQYLTNSSLARSILRDSGPTHDHDHNHNDFPPTSHDLPPYDSMIEIVFAAFSNVFGLCNIVVEHEFRIVAQRLYEQNPKSYTPQDTEFVPLFDSVIALGIISSASCYHTLGYEEALKQRYVELPVGRLFHHR